MEEGTAYLVCKNKLNYIITNYYRKILFLEGFMKTKNLCKVDCVGILKSLIDEGCSGDELFLSFREKYLQTVPGCFCDFILRDLIAEGKAGEDLLVSFREKQKQVIEGYRIVNAKPIKD